MRLKAHWARIVIASIALAFGFSDTAIARQVTFAWDTSPDWPAGTTVELEANGVSANGISGTQYTLNVPVQPGEVIIARARAIPPSGYECGDPIALCLSSDFVTLAQTVPSDPSGLMVTKELLGVNKMAAERTGSGLLTQVSSGSSFSFTIPTDANFLVFYVTGAVSNNSADIITTLNFDNSGLDFTQLTKSWYYGPPTGYVQVQVLYIGSDSPNWPGTGTKTIYYGTGASIIEGLNIFVQAYKGVDLTSPIVNTDTRVGGSDAWTSSMSDPSANDLGVIVSYRYSTTAVDNAINGQTLVVRSSSFNSASIGIFEELGEGQLSAASGSDQVIAAFILKGTSGSTTNISTTSIDALVKKTGITATSSLSALLQKSFSGTVSLDSMVAAIKSGNVSIDALLKATNKYSTVSADGLLQAVKTGSVSIDAAIAIIVSATSGIDALLQNTFNATAGLDAIISGSSTVTASLDGLLQSGKSTTALIDALLQAGYLSQTDIDAIIAKEFISTTSLDALLQLVATTATSLDAIISGGSSAAVVLDALLQTGAVSTASIDAVLQKSSSNTASLDAFIQGSASAVASLDGLVQAAKTGTLSLDAIIVSAGQALATTSLDGLVQAVKTGSVSLDAMIAVPVAGATAGLDALLSVTSVSTVSIGALLQAAKTGIISIDGLIQSAKTAQVSIDGLVQSAKTGTVSLDAVVGIIGSAAISLDGILQKSRASGVFIDAIIGLISAIIMPTGRVISIASTDRSIVISETDRFIVIPNSDRSVLN